ncbi:hypothetical protein C8J56DRAFT_921935 [Mycena floridula]|nr:hypothetical protein C8J56DRAFT_921935 [Mycena floridula]
MHSNSFSVAGMTTSTSSHHNPAPWNSMNSGPSASMSTSTMNFGDSLAQSSRSHYQSGYLMSASQANASPQGNQRSDEMAIVPTKAKMNHSLMRGSASDFGMDSMFESSRSRKPMGHDEDAPPTSSVNDIPNEIYTPSSRFQPRNSTAESSLFSSRGGPPPLSATASGSQSQIVWIIVFGYPADKYTLTVEYFKSFGETTEAEANLEITNCFRLGYKDAGEAMRAVRKNGEILGGSWMVGVKWADPVQVDAMLGQSRVLEAPPSAMAVDEPHSPFHTNSNAGAFHSTPSVGTPIKLAPSASAFRKSGASTPVTQPPRPLAGWSGTPSTPGAAPVQPQVSPTKGVIGQVSDMIFGW